MCEIQIPFFDDVGAVTLQYFDSLFQRDNLQKSQFYKGLPKVLPKLPKVVQSNECCSLKSYCITASGTHSVYLPLREWWCIESCLL